MGSLGADAGIKAATSTATSTAPASVGAGRIQHARRPGAVTMKLIYGLVLAAYTLAIVFIGFISLFFAGALGSRW